MTFERLCFLEVSDITGIEVKCSKCNYRWIRQVDNWIKDSVTCANCGAIWFLQNSTDLQNMKNFVASLGAISDLIKRQNGSPFTIRFEVKCPEMEKK